MNHDPSPVRAVAAEDPPRLAVVLGHAGLVPFVAGALAVWVAPEGLRAGAASALQAYAAVIVSFLAGLHWGLAMQAGPRDRAAPLWWGITASLAAWLALLAPRPIGLVLCGALLLACYAVDRRLYPPAGAAGWLRLRLRLSAVAGLSCFLAAPAV